MSFEQPAVFPDDYRWGTHVCGSCDRAHYGPYELWCRAERQRLFPARFREWTAEEHEAKRKAGRTVLTYDQQQTVWHHRDTWEAMYDGKLTQAQAATLLANSEPLPRANVLAPMIQTVARSMAARSRRTEEPAYKPEQEAFAMAVVRRITPEQMAAEEERLTGKPVTEGRRREIRTMLASLYGESGRERAA